MKLLKAIKKIFVKRNKDEAVIEDTAKKKIGEEDKINPPVKPKK